MKIEPEILSLRPNQPTDFTVYYNECVAGQTHEIVSLEIDDVKIEYVKKCRESTHRAYKYLLSSGSLLLMAVIVLSIAVKQDQFKFVQDSEEGEIYEIQSISIRQTIGILVFASTVLFGFYLMIKFFSLIWLVTIFFLFSMGSLLIPFFMEIIDMIAKGNVKSICNWSLFQGVVSIKSISAFLMTTSLMLSWYFTKNWILSNVIG